MTTNKPEVLEIQDSLESAREVKLVFGDDYLMYCEWCAQFTSATNPMNGEKVEAVVMPVSLIIYKEIQP